MPTGFNSFIAWDYDLNTNENGIWFAYSLLITSSLHCQLLCYEKPLKPHTYSASFNKKFITSMRKKSDMDDEIPH